MTFATVGSVVGIATGINALTGGGVTNALGLGPSGGSTYGTATGTQAAADPFAAYRGGLAQMYSNALQQGATTDITKLPGYSQYQSGVVDPALEATKRTMAASGQMQSGNEQIALNKQAQQGYYSFMTDYLNRLAQGSGATNNPATAASLGSSVYNQQQAGVMQGLGATVQGLASLYGSTSTPGYTVDPTGMGMSSIGAVDTSQYGGAYGLSIR